MKVAITGKGGTGKSTVAAAMALLMARRGMKILAADADPDANLASALGIPIAEQARIHTIARERALIEERTGARVRELGQMFRLNPDVSDIADRFAYRHRGVSLVVLGASESGGSGCACPENTLLRALVSELVLRREEILVMDMEAGTEHLGRATAAAVDAAVIVAEPGQRAVASARRIARMATDIGIRRLLLLANKIRSPADVTYLTEALPELPLLATIPFADCLLQADRDGVSVLDGASAAVRQRLASLVDSLQRLVRQVDDAAPAMQAPPEVGARTDN